MTLKKGVAVLQYLDIDRISGDSNPSPAAKTKAANGYAMSCCKSLGRPGHAIWTGAYV